MSPFLSLWNLGILKHSMILEKPVQKLTEMGAWGPGECSGLPPFSRGRPSCPSTLLSLREAGTSPATPPPHPLSHLSHLGPWPQLASGDMVCSRFPSGHACSGCIFLRGHLGSQGEQTGTLITPSPQPPANSRVPLATHTWRAPPQEACRMHGSRKALLGASDPTQRDQELGHLGHGHA